MDTLFLAELSNYVGFEDKKQRDEGRRMFATGVALLLGMGALVVEKEDGDEVLINFAAMLELFLKGDAEITFVPDPEAEKKARRANLQEVKK